MDSGVGRSVYDGGGRSNRERLLPRGWMDSGLGSLTATVTDRMGRGGHVAEEMFQLSPNSSETKDALDTGSNHASKINS
jgi:hypothetical protein